MRAVHVRRHDDEAQGPVQPAGQAKGFTQSGPSKHESVKPLAFGERGSAMSQRFFRKDGMSEPKPLTFSGAGSRIRSSSLRL